MKLSKTQVKDINLEYLPRLTVSNAEEYLTKAKIKSARVRRQLNGQLDVPFGNSLGQTCDIFQAPKRTAPVHIFIHGGYWRSLDKDIYSYLAKPLVRSGATVVLPNYDLCPTVKITDIVQQMQRMIVWVYKNIKKFNGDPTKIFVSGHSAGGHLTAMLAATNWSKHGRLPKSILKGIAPISGLFDIKPHRHSDLQPDIRLTAKEAALMSPMYLEPKIQCPAIIAVGGNEPDSFHWQSLQYTAKLRKHRIKADFLAMQGDNHFSITDRLGNARDPLTKALIAQMGL